MDATDGRKQDLPPYRLENEAQSWGDIWETDNTGSAVDLVQNWNLPPIGPGLFAATSIPDFLKRPLCDLSFLEDRPRY